jgi:hypothetical protein
MINVPSVFALTLAASVLKNADAGKAGTIYKDVVADWLLDMAEMQRLKESHQEVIVPAKIIPIQIGPANDPEAIKEYKNAMVAGREARLLLKDNWNRLNFFQKIRSYFKTKCWGLHWGD